MQLNGDQENIFYFVIDATSLVLKKVFHKISKYTILKKEYLILESSLKHYPKISDHDIREASQNPKFLNDIKINCPDKYILFKKRLDQNLTCLSLYSHEVLCGYSWFATEDYYEPGFRHTITLDQHSIYQFDGYLAPKFRKGMLAIKIMRIFYNYFIDKGYTTSVALVSKSKEKNLKFHVYLGFQETGMMLVTYLIFRIPFTRLKTYSERYVQRKKSNMTNFTRSIENQKN